MNTEINSAQPVESVRGLAKKNLIWWVIGGFVAIILIMMTLSANAPKTLPPKQDEMAIAVDITPDKGKLEAIKIEQEKKVADTKPEPPNNSSSQMPVVNGQLVGTPVASNTVKPESAYASQDAKVKQAREEAEASNAPLLVFGDTSATASRNKVLEDLSANLEKSRRISEPQDAVTQVEKVLQKFGPQSNAGSIPQISQESKTVEEQWLARNTKTSASNTSAGLQDAQTAIAPRKSPGRYALMQSTVIPAVLEQDLNSSLPGSIRAVVKSDIYDSFGNGILLIPKYSRLIGTYQADPKPGQERLLAAFQRIVYPNGLSIDIGSQAYDATGRAGLDVTVDNQFWKMFGASGLIALVASAVTPKSNGQVVINTGGASGTNPAGQILVDVSGSILNRYKNLPPILKREKGYEFIVEVSKDIVFPAGAIEQLK